MNPDETTITESAPGATGSSDSGWQVVGELELSSGVDAHYMLDVWLLDTLTPLHLHTGFLNKIRKSVADETTRGMQADTVTKNERTHLLIFIPSNRPVNIYTWGYFRLEKVEPVVDDDNSYAHSVELYLFPEGR